MSLSPPPESALRSSFPARHHSARRNKCLHHSKKSAVSLRPVPDSPPELEMQSRQHLHRIAEALWCLLQADREYLYSGMLPCCSADVRVCRKTADRLQP